MCGRYALAAAPDELVDAFDLREVTFAYEPRYNIAPGTEAPVVAEDRKGRRIGLLTWGLAPGWMDAPGSGFINARAETLDQKASFREAFARRRCLVPANGFYEWAREGGTKVPHWVHSKDHGLVSFAGLWETWRRPGVEPRHTFAIVTTDSNEDVRAIHDRMPVIVPPADRDAWLDRTTDPEELRRMLRPAPAGSLTSHRVSTRVNRPVEDDPSLLDPAE